MSFGDNLRQMRISSGYTLEKLGDLIGVSPQAVYRWEVGKTEPNMKTVARICEIFHCTADELAGYYTQPMTKTERDIVVAYRDSSEEVKGIVRTILKVEGNAES